MHVYVLAFALAATPALANDSIAGFGVGGLELRTTDAIRMVREDLFISPAQIRVSYVFRNETDLPVTAIVAFPLPAVGGTGAFVSYALPRGGALDYVGFKTVIDGEPTNLTPEHRVTVGGVDRTEAFVAIGVPAVASRDWDLFDQGQRAWTPEQGAALAAQGFLDERGYPNWALQSTFWREQIFAPHTDVHVEHSYNPVAAASLNSWFPAAEIPADPPADRAQGWLDYARTINLIRERYCPEPEVEAAMRAQVDGETGLVGFSTFFSSEVDYILTTGANWRGPIGEFRLVVESPNAWDFVFLCLPGAVRVAPNRIEFEAQDYTPVQDLSVYVSHAVGEAIEALRQP